MTSVKFSKSHEREEARLLGKGFARSWIGLFLCWLPVAGLLFAIGGFARTVVRITRKHRVRRRVYLAFSLLVLVLCVGALMGEIWIYSRDPAILNRLGDKAWTFVTGQNGADPIATPAPGGTHYDDMDTAGLGVSSGTGELQQESDGLTEDDTEDWQTWDENFDWEGWEDAEIWSEADGSLDGTEDDSLVWDTDVDEADFGSDMDDWPFEDDAMFGDEAVSGDDAFFDESASLGETGDAAQNGSLEDEGLDWLEEGEDGIIWLDENGEPLPPEKTLHVGAGEVIVLPK